MNSDIRIFKDHETLSRHAAELFVDRAASAINDQKRFLVALNGGNTPTHLFQLLASDYRNKVDWTKVHIFWGDERCVPYTDPGSSYGQAHDALLRHVPVPPDQIHAVETSLVPPEAAKAYTQTLKEFASPPLEIPRFDLVYLGMGEDGHTASLFPNSRVAVTEPVLPVTAQYQDRPANRVTLTQLVFNRAHTVVFMATGEKKAATLKEVLGTQYHPEQYPAQRIDPQDGQLIWLVDEAAASQLPRKTRGLKFCEG
jgi:6-phosphogluconolactonase